MGAGARSPSLQVPYGHLRGHRTGSPPLSARLESIVRGRPPLASNARVPNAGPWKRKRIVSIRVAIEHRTEYRYDKPVQLGPHVVRLRPAPHCRTPILSYSLRVTPEEHFVNWQQDPAGNHQARFVFPEPTTELSVTVDLVAEMTAINPFDFFVDEYATDVAIRLRARSQRTSSSHTSTPRSPARCWTPGWRRSIAPPPSDHRLPRRAQPASLRRCRLLACGWKPAFRRRRRP